MRSGHEWALPDAGRQAGGLGGRQVGGGPRPGLATGRARGALPPSGPWAPAPCPSAVEDAGLWGRWPGGRKPGGASWLVPGSGDAAGTPQSRDGGMGAISRAVRAGRLRWRRDPLPEARGAVRGGTAACGCRGPPGLVGDAALTPPRGCLAGCVHLPCGGTRLSGPAEPAGAVGPGEVPRGPLEAGVENEGPTPVGQAQGQRCVSGWHDYFVYTPYKICQMNSLGRPQFGNSLFPPFTSIIKAIRSPFLTPKTAQKVL